MPFRKVGPNQNVSPSGKTFTDKQVRTYYATDGFQKPALQGRTSTRNRLKQDRLDSTRHIRERALSDGAVSASLGVYDAGRRDVPRAQ